MFSRDFDITDDKVFSRIVHVIIIEESDLSIQLVFKRLGQKFGVSD